MEKIVFNPDYYLKNDIKRVFIINKKNNYNSSDGWSSMLHPIHAIIFSFFSKNDSYENVLNNLSDFLSMSKNEVKEIISPFIENNEDVYVEFDGIEFDIPRNVLIRTTEIILYKYNYNIEDFVFSDFDFKTKRYLSGPLNITFMPDNICVTDCIYCYADKKHKVNEYISFERIKKIIDEAFELRMLDFSAVGGEIFTYPYWRELLKYIKEKDFNMIRISTKVPLTYDDIIFLKNIGITEIQISLDSLVLKEMEVLLKVSENYYNKIQKTIQMLSDEKFNIVIATILTKYNTNIKSIESINNFIKDLNISSWNITPGIESIYKPEQSFRSSKNDLYKVFEYIEEVSKNSKIIIEVDKTFFDRTYKNSVGGSVNFEGAACSALMSHLFILPDGKVTICEQLYWIPQFIVGDLNYQSIKEVWNSPKSNYFLNLKRSDFQETSACGTCGVFDVCYNSNNLNKCWAETIKAYGIKNWDYPDPRCKFAPEFANDLNYN